MLSFDAHWLYCFTHQAVDPRICDSRVAIWSLTYERSQLAQIAILLYLGYITTEYEVEDHQYTNTRQVL